MAEAQTLTKDLPAQIGAYRIVRLLGEGGMSRVYLGHESDEIRVAVKVCAPTVVKKLDWAERMVNELQHPNLMRYRGLPFDRQHKYLVVADYLDVVPVTHDRLATRTLEEVVEIIAKAAEALAFLGTKGLVHGTVKPSNILCRRAKSDMMPLVADAGLRYVYDPAVIRGEAATRLFPYMAPEILEAFTAAPKTEQPATSAGDVYALAVTLAEALTSTTPFRLNVDDPSNPAEMLAAKRKKRYRIIFKNDPTTPLDAKKMDDLITASIDPRPEKRPALKDMPALLRATIDAQRLAAIGK